MKAIDALLKNQIEDHGFLTGSFPSSAQISLDRLKNIITNDNLQQSVIGFIGIYPRRLLSLDDKTAFRWKGAVIDADIDSLREIKTISFPPGQYAVFKHFGPYEFTPQSWNRVILGWLPRSGKQPRGANLFEVYLLPPSYPICPEQLSAYLLLPVH